MDAVWPCRVSGGAHRGRGVAATGRSGGLGGATQAACRLARHAAGDAHPVRRRPRLAHGHRAARGRCARRCLAGAGGFSRRPVSRSRLGQPRLLPGARSWRLARAEGISWPAPGVLHVVAFDGPVERYFGAAEVIELRVSEKGLQKLIDHVRASHELDAAGRPIQLGPGLYGRSRFYASSERFHLFRTCNVWVAVALREAGLPVAPAQSITAEQLLARLRPLGWVPGTGSATCASLRRIYSPCGGFMVWMMGGRAQWAAARPWMAV